MVNVASTRNLGDTVEEEVMVCTDCFSDQPEKYAMKQVTMGWQGPVSSGPYVCKYCGGPAVIVTVGERDRALAAARKSKGL